MSLVAGTRLGPYEIQSGIGAGGMGEVYKARDTRLDRTVAIKVLPPELSADPDRRVRFEREARAIAALSHPHICTLYDIGTHDGTTYLVLEHLPGQTLADRLLRGSLPLAQALEIAAQIAEALDAAHKHGIIHRDLKPGNVMLPSGGAGRSGVTTAKLLDFGLAKLARHGERPALASETHAVTAAAPVTARGTILGTLPYMAPEQLEGKEADARTDLWALGTVLHEMVTGKRAFTGDTEVSLIGNIMNAEPAALATLQPLTPPALDRVVKKCLAKHPDDRWDSAHDVADELCWIAQGAGVPVAPPTTRIWLARATWGLALVAAAAAGAMAARWLDLPGLGAPRAGDARPVAHIDLVLPADAPFWIDPQMYQPSFAISPDGATIVYACARGGATQLCVRRLDRADVAPMAGTQGARYPAFSPDGRRVVFCVADRNVFCEAGAPIKTLAVANGRVDTLGAVPDAMAYPLTFTWTADDRILVSGYGGIWAMPAAGGAAAPVVRADAARGELAFVNAALLPGGARMIFARIHQQGAVVGTEVRVLTMATGEQRTVLKDVGDPRYLPSGHLVYQQGIYVQQGVNAGRLVAAPFDAARLEAGPPVRLVDPIRQTGSWMAFAVSHSGTLLYLPYETDRVLMWVDRQQRAVPALAATRAWGGLRLSPDGRRAAVETTPERSTPGIEIVDLARGISTPFAADGRNPAWTRDGARIAFSTSKGERLVWQASDGSGAPEVLHESSIDCSAGSWSPDGRLAFSRPEEGSRTEVWVLSTEGASWAPRRFLSAAQNRAVWVPRFSPDGRWMAYQSDESGTTEVYVQAYPEGGQRTQVSGGGGHDPVWSPDGRELFYRNGDSFYAVPVSAGRPFTAGLPRAMFSGPYLDSGTFAPSNYDVSPDGQRFLVVRVSDEERAPRRFHLVQNWLEEVKVKVPAGRAGK